MCIDTDNSVLYLLGGWDGIKDLADFWAFHCNTGKWECLSIDTQSDVCFDDYYHFLHSSSICC